MKYFANCHTLDELEKEFRRLAMLHHPDHGGDVETMKAINNEYDAVFPAFRLAYNKTAETPTTETAASTRSEFYTQNGWKGSRYDSSRSLKEIAEAVRQFIKEQFPTYKFSVRTKYASMCQELIVELKEAPCKVYKDFSELTEQDKHDLIRRMKYSNVFTMTCWNDSELEQEFTRIWNERGNWYRCVSDQIKATAEAVDEYVNSYNYHDCDGMIDYFDVNFYYFGCMSDNIKFVTKTARITAKKESKPQNPGNSGFLRVEINTEFDGVEVYFPSKPSEETRAALKTAGYRWQSKKKCWYAKNTEKNLQALRSIETGLTA
ncbi:MAG: LPD29 domain-containing protein [Faecousia sp.]